MQGVHQLIPQGTAIKGGRPKVGTSTTKKREQDQEYGGKNSVRKKYVTNTKGKKGKSGGQQQHGEMQQLWVTKTFGVKSEKSPKVGTKMAKEV